jgi:phosphomethylpyrimidine synthase
MKITEDAVPHCGTAEQGLAEEQALKAGMEQKAREFVEKGAEIYAKV